MFYCAELNFSVEALQIYGANVVSFHMASGGQRGHIVGCYLAPDYSLTTEDFFLAISQRPRGGAYYWQLEISTLTWPHQSAGSGKRVFQRPWRRR